MEMARLDHRDDVLLAQQDNLRRVNGATGSRFRETSLAAKDQPLVDRVFHAMSGRRPFFWQNIFGSAGAGYEPPCLVRPLIDVDGDGTPDLIWASPPRRRWPPRRANRESCSGAMYVGRDCPTISAKRTSSPGKTTAKASSATWSASRCWQKPGGRKSSFRSSHSTMSG